MDENKPSECRVRDLGPLIIDRAGFETLCRGPCRLEGPSGRAPNVTRVTDDDILNFNPVCGVEFV